MKAEMTLQTYIPVNREKPIQVAGITIATKTVHAIAAFVPYRQSATKDSFTWMLDSIIHEDGTYEILNNQVYLTTTLKPSKYSKDGNEDPAVRSQNQLKRLLLKHGTKIVDELSRAIEQAETMPVTINISHKGIEVKTVKTETEVATVKEKGNDYELEMDEIGMEL